MRVDHRECRRSGHCQGPRHIPSTRTIGHPFTRVVVVAVTEPVADRRQLRRAVRHRFWVRPLAAALLIASPPGWALTWDTDIRVRYEGVEDERYTQTSEALTGRLHLGLRTAALCHSYLAGSVEFVGHLGDARYADGVHRRPQYPDIADPDAEELDELYFGHRIQSELGIVDTWAGRRAWFQDHQRFFGGGAGWRQNGQSWEGVGLIWSFHHWSAEAVLVMQVRRPAGNHSPRGRQDLDGRILHISGPLMENLTAALFVHWLDYAPGPAIEDSASNRTMGGTLGWSKSFGRLGLSLRADLARQSGWHTPAPSSEGLYRSIEVGLSQGSWRLMASRELLGGDGDIAFQTPLAGLHAFNGHADRFLKTPAQGLDDRALGLGWKHGHWQVQTTRHWYASTEGALEYGTETDTAVLYALPRGQRLIAKWARYSGSDDAEVARLAPLQAADVDKVWLLWEWKWSR